MSAPAAASGVAAPARQHHPVAGIAFMLGGVVLGTCMDAALKFTVAANAALQITALRALFILVFAIPLVVRAGGWRVLRTTRPGAHALRVAAAVGGTVCFLNALGRLPLATAIAIGMSAPLFMTVLSVPLLRERVGIHRWGAVIVGFAGVLVITRPGVGGVIDAGALFMLAAAVLFALSMVAVRWLPPSESEVTLTVYAGLGALAVGGASLPVVWTTPSPFEWAMIALASLLMLWSQLLSMRAFRMAPVGVLSPFYYTELVWAAALGWIFWRESVAVHVWFGSAIVVGSGLYTLWREQRAARAR